MLKSAILPQALIGHMRTCWHFKLEEVVTNLPWKSVRPTDCFGTFNRRASRCWTPTQSEHHNSIDYLFIPGACLRATASPLNRASQGVFTATFRRCGRCPRRSCHLPSKPYQTAARAPEIVLAAEKESHAKTQSEWLLVSPKPMGTAADQQTNIHLQQALINHSSSCKSHMPVQSASSRY